MSDSPHSTRFPNESPQYRTARDELLLAEIDLRERMEAVAALRRRLPPGGAVPQDYAFDEIVSGTKRATRLSELFAGAPSLIVYSFMYGPAAEHACPMCTSFLDGLDRTVLHVGQRVPVVVVARSPIERIRAFAEARGWSRLRLLSSSDNSYNADYHAETPSGAQMPACNVFTSRDGRIRHSWAAEMLYAPSAGHARHIDLLWPIWSLFDLTPEGRENWMPRLVYDGPSRDGG
jgi:predicted dithiol-disulfide oxidoreductase (DUF899 family)